MADLKSLFIEVLKKLDLIPQSGYGSVTINFQNFKIVNVDKKESMKL